MNITIIAFLLGFLLDLILGDPHSIPHPVCFIGKLISTSEKFLRRCFPKTKRGELVAGAVLCFIVISISGLIPFVLLYIAGIIHPMVRLLVETVMCYQILATKSLRVESMKVYRELEKEDIVRARYQLSMIVGRDTDSLTEEGIIKAAVETVAENTSDGIIAPMLYLAIGGPILGFIYKAINTMDSMVAYKNERYLYFGRVAARLDDVANFIPSRIAALLMIIASGICEVLDFIFSKRISTSSNKDGKFYSMKRAAKTFLRDRYQHASPNSAQTEAVCAGALGIQLAGDAYYHGVLHKKEFIGDSVRKIQIKDIIRANVLLYVSAFLCMGLCMIIKIVIL
ncbi:adenosylcobinamide-phosphate synthase CbiB [Lachnoclostridium phytofermentans]|uniref:Cobalamin biosynthesis protein CobD n=1 Tax=Lachnoclostridium phytofermentans (strain ATCC 700394 / DSM 18823 / ISDg) TaxID=357809 RepID=A9KMP3_LACP7|nr:adenosylcobinamide-phosphate synthase CbiB [Lachnoclostridium phytofermentans]ABX41488.1 cobalamin biosynthesis protein CobD [Lachnoclostridium phytofermentans ISDg]